MLPARRSQDISAELPQLWVIREQLKRRSLVEMPYLIGIDDMPSTDLLALQEIVNCRYRRANTLIGSDRLSGAMDLPEPAAFGMRPQFQVLDDCARRHLIRFKFLHVGPADSSEPMRSGTHVSNPVAYCALPSDSHAASAEAGKCLPIAAIARRMYFVAILGTARNAS
jgi:hypothetical protein